jgi:hypothetical protein
MTALRDNEAEQVGFCFGKYRQLASIGTPHKPPSEIYGW